MAISKEEIGMILAVGGIVWLLSKITATGKSAVTTGSSLLDRFKGKKTPSRNDLGPSIDAMTDIKRSALLNGSGPALYSPYVRAAAAVHRVPYDVLMGLFHNESGFRPKAISYAGAVGLGQLFPGAATDMGLKVPSMNKKLALAKNPTKDHKIDERFNPIKNIFASAKYMRWLKNRGHIDTWTDALGAYKVGTGWMKKIKADPGKYPEKEAEAQKYINNVTGFAERYA